MKGEDSQLSGVGSCNYLIHSLIYISQDAQKWFIKCNRCYNESLLLYFLKFLATFASEKQLITPIIGNFCSPKFILGNLEIYGKEAWKRTSI